jgi:hypothetical protein
MLRGKARGMGLCSYQDVGLADAQEMAKALRKLRRQGIDPIEHSNAETAGAGLSSNERRRAPEGSMQRRDFLLSVTMVSAISIAAWAQQVPPAAGPAGGGTATAGSIPDFSGTWAHPYLTGFEPPASGPGPVRNRSRRRDGAGNFQQLVGDYTNPILQPWAAEVVKKHGEISLAGEGYPTPSNQCWPGGVPYVFWDFLLQIFQRPDHILMVYRQGHELRRVRMNEPHPAQVAPSWYGDSVGHYEGDTLVIDTVGIKIGPFAMVDMYGTPHSPALHVVERYRLIDYDDANDALERNAKENFYIPAAGATGIVEVDLNYRGKVLQLHFTVEDDGVFTAPWTATITYRPNIGPWTEVICAENIQWYSGTNSAVPQADKPDF